MDERAGEDAWLIAAETALGRRDLAWPGGVEGLLDPAFREVGASGRTWTRATVGTILAHATPDTVRFEAFAVERVGDDVALVTYRTVEPTRVALRVSVWTRGADGAWRLHYHQGTMTAPDTDRRVPMADVDVVSGADLPTTEPVTPGMDRRLAFRDDTAWVGTVRTEAGTLTGWHSHPGYDTYIGVTSGHAVVEFGPEGAGSLTAGPGDIIRIGRGVVHREGTAAGSNGVEALLFRVGAGDVVQNVDGPDPA